MTEYSEVQVWSIINGEDHPDLARDKCTIAGYIPLIKKLFPGINYYSITGFSQVMKNYVRPALSKLFPDLKGKPAKEISLRAVSIETFLPSKGYEHLDPKWGKKLQKLLE